MGVGRVIVCTACGYSNSPDADFCLNPSLPNGRGPCGEYLGWAKRDQASPTAESTAGATAAGEPPESARSGSAGQVDVSASLTPAQLSVEPGGEVTCEIRVRNLGTVVDRFQLELQGNPGQWSLIEPATLSLFPETESSAVLHFRPPRTPRVQAGRPDSGSRLLPAPHRRYLLLPRASLTFDRMRHSRRGSCRRPLAARSAPCTRSSSTTRATRRFG